MSVETATNPQRPPLPPALPAEPGALKRGDTLGGRFVLDEPLGQDGVGTAWQAVDEKSGKRIVVWLLDTALVRQKATVDRLRNAVKIASGLSHKNIVGTFGMGKEGNRRYVARAFVDGRSLIELLDRKVSADKRFSFKGAYNLIAHICNALEYARTLMPHGTLRPSNVYVNRAGRVKVTDFGLSGLQPALSAGASELNTWDVPFAEGSLTDPAQSDVRMAGLLLATLLLAKPVTVAGIEDSTGELPEGLREIVLRCIDREHPEALPTPGAVKAALQEAMSAVQVANSAEESIEVQAPVQTPPDMPGAAPQAPAPAPKPKKALKAPPPPTAVKNADPDDPQSAAAAKSGGLQRWLVSRDGTDFGPFTHKEIVEQLFEEEIVETATVYDIETDTRRELSEFPAFEDDLLAWIHEKAKREKVRAEKAARAKARRRNRILFLVVGLPMIAAAVLVGGWFWYQSTLPTPKPVHLASLITKVQGALPVVELPEELPETLAEKKARVKAVSEARATAFARKESRQMAKEERQAASSELTTGTGARFNRRAFDQAIARRTNKLVKCLEAEARRDPALASVQVKITVIPKGDLINVKLRGGSSRGNRCVRGALAGVKVPAFDGSNHKVTLPFQIR